MRFGEEAGQGWVEEQSAVAGAGGETTWRSALLRGRRPSSASPEGGLERSGAGPFRGLPSCALRRAARAPRRGIRKWPSSARWARSGDRGDL